MSNKVLLHGNLSILIKRAINLKNMDGLFAGKSDPYVYVELDGHKICRTKTIDNNLNPYWNHPLVLQLCASYKEIKFIVYDDDNLNQDDVIGVVIIPCEQIIQGEKMDKIFNLDPKANGQLELSIKWIGSDKISQSYEVPEVPFTSRPGNKVTLYQKAHFGTNHAVPVPIVIKPHFGFHAIKKMIKDKIKIHHAEPPEEREYVPGNCWVDVTRALYNAKKFIYITGWSVWVKLRLVRQDYPEDVPEEFAKLTLGEMLKQKASEGVVVNLLIWNEATSAFGFGGLMCTHDEETQQYFADSSVKVKLAYRKGVSSGSEFIWTHHQKSIILDAAIEDSDKRRIKAFVGGLDLCDGRYDTPNHSLFRTLQTEHCDDFHQVWLGVTQDCGPREPWHDIHGQIEGPAARDVLRNFELRWNVQASNHLNRLFKITNDEFITIEGEAELNTDPNASWNVQLFRSIDKYSSLMLTDATIEKSVQLAYIHNIRRAKHFIYIENQYFLGSAHAWLNNAGEGIDCENLIPIEIVAKIVSSIKKRKAFCAYILLPMYPEGIPEDNAVQEILHWQWLTIQMMYKRVHDALEEEGLLGAHRPEDYLNFYCLGNRESEDGSEAKSNECSDPNRPKQRLLLNSRRFMIYVHSKMMIVDDEYIIFGSANINERSMAGDRDTEIAVGCYQPQFVATSSVLPHGDVHAFRVALWATHTKTKTTLFDNPETPDCAKFLNEIANRNWDDYARDDVVEMKSQLMKYPIEVDDSGFICLKENCKTFPDTTAKICGTDSNIPNLLTL